MGDGNCAIGAWLMLAEAHTAEMAARIGYDFVVIDLQHGLISEGDAAAMIRAVELGGARPVVRCASCAPEHVGRMLDLGAESIIAPMIETVADVHRLVAVTRYAPDGLRSFGPSRVAIKHDNYFRDAARRFDIFPMIETKSALEAVEEIAAIDGVAGLFVGPADLSLSLGLEPARDNADPAFVAAIERVIAACRRHGRIAGIQAERRLAAKRIGEGFNFLTVSLDVSDLKDAFSASLGVARDAARGAR